jgi:hypothetical protein
MLAMLKQRDQSFVKYATEGRFWPFRLMFDRIASTIRLTNFKNSNAIIFLFCI